MWVVKYDVRSLIDIFESQGDWRYYKCCVDFAQKDVPDLQDMIDEAEEVTYEFFEQNVGRFTLQESFPDYNWTRNPRNGLMMKDDWHVRYHRSTFVGNPCFFVVHSAIEYIFLPNGADVPY